MTRPQLAGDTETGPGTAADYNYAAFSFALNPIGMQRWLTDGPRPGETAPGFRLETLEGTTISLNELRGRPVVLEFGSYTCPIFCAHIEPMESIAQRHPEAVFLVIYTREAHPGEAVTAHQTIGYKRQAALRLVADEPLRRAVLLDDLEGTVHRAYGQAWDSTYVIDSGGTVVLRQAWTRPEDVDAVLADLAAGTSVVPRQTTEMAPLTGRPLSDSLLRGGRKALLDFYTSAPSPLQQHIRESASAAVQSVLRELTTQAHAADPAAERPVGWPDQAPPGLRIEVPRRALVDDPIGAVIGGCPPGAPVRVTASVRFDGSVHEATASFIANDAGVVDTARHVSTAGSYTGADPFGLWWSAQPTAPMAGAAAPPAPVACRLRAETGNRTVCAEFERHWLAPGATVTEVREPGVCGMFARPAGPGPFPGVVAFGGSGGGLGPAAAWAPVLASRGLATLAIAYFGAPGLPGSLAGIEVEVVERAAGWLLGRDDVAPRTVAVMGMSRGSELALWAGALLDTVGAVVAFAPSGISWSGLDATGPVDAPAWAFRAQPLPYAPIGTAAKASLAQSGGPVALRGAFEPILANPRLFEHAVIPVETIRGPVLFVSGEADTMWPATPMTQIAEQRAAGRGFRHPLVHLRYRDGGHVCAGVPGTPVVTEAQQHPLTGGCYTFGGTRAGNAHARADSWPRVVAFLRGTGVGRSRTGEDLRRSSRRRSG